MRVGDVRRAVAQAMRYAGCLNRRSLGVSDVFPAESAGKQQPQKRGQGALPHSQHGQCALPTVRCTSDTVRCANG